MIFFHLWGGGAYTNLNSISPEVQRNQTKYKFIIFNVLFEYYFYFFKAAFRQSVCHGWMSHFLDVTLFGFHTFWMSHFLDAILSGCHPFWMPHFLDVKLSVFHTFRGQYGGEAPHEGSKRPNPHRRSQYTIKQNILVRSVEQTSVCSK